MASTPNPNNRKYKHEYRIWWLVSPLYIIKDVLTYTHDQSDELVIRESRYLPENPKEFTAETEMYACQLRNLMDVSNTIYFKSKIAEQRRHFALCRARGIHTYPSKYAHWAESGSWKGFEFERTLSKDCLVRSRGLPSRILDDDSRTERQAY